jgi:ribonucleotide reductase beta subunit family protein with ferritin-like domain
MAKIKNRWEVWNTGIDTSWFVKRFKYKKDAIKYKKLSNKRAGIFGARFHVRDNKNNYEIVSFS